MRPLGACLSNIGLIADTQYSQHEDKLNYSGTHMRFYRNSLKHLNNAVNSWLDEEVHAVVHLGDIMDGYCRRDGHRDAAELEYLNVMQPIDSANIPVHYCVGNHELYNYSRKELWQTPFMKVARRSVASDNNEIVYYSFRPCSGYRILIIDSFEICLMGTDESSEIYQSAYNFIRRWNSNKDWNDHMGLEKPHLVAYNGAISDQQLSWIEKELQEAEAATEKVIIMGHVPSCPGFLDSPSSIMWNYEELLTIMRAYSTTVMAMLTGHTHKSGLWSDPDSQHRTLHVTFPGVVETSLSDSAHSTLRLHEHGIVISGNSTMDTITHTTF